MPFNWDNSGWKAAFSCMLSNQILITKYNSPIVKFTLNVEKSMVSTNAKKNRIVKENDIENHKKI